MTQGSEPQPLARDADYFALKQEIEDFLYYEADLLDERRWDEWLALLTDDVVYFMPMRRNVKSGRHAAHENTREGKDINWFEDDKWTLQKRVEQIATGVHWAEEPLSRVCHVVGNVRLIDARPSAAAASEATVKSKFVVHQNRVQYESNLFIGKKTDRLRKVDGAWKLARREVILDQSVLLAKNLSIIL